MDKDGDGAREEEEQMRKLREMEECRSLRKI